MLYAETPDSRGAEQTDFEFTLGTGMDVHSLDGQLAELKSKKTIYGAGWWAGISAQLFYRWVCTIPVSSNFIMANRHYSSMDSLDKKSWNDVAMQQRRERATSDGRRLREHEQPRIVAL